MSLSILTLLVAGISAAGTYAIREYSGRRGLLDRPNHRSSHTVPTPRLGGVALGFATIVGWLSLLLWFADTRGLVLALAAGGTIATVVGLVDDVWSISPAGKFGGQLLAIAVPIAFVWGTQGPVSPFWLALLALVVLTYMNFFNFMDGSDGLAAGVAFFSALGLAVLGSAAGADVALWMSVVLGAATAGFLVYNLPPASIFMGDSGSLFLGYSLAAIAVLMPRTSTGIIESLAVLIPFFFDAGFTLVRRAVRGEVLWRAHRSHIYQRLLTTGATHLQVAMLYVSWAIVASAVAWTSTLVAQEWTASVLLLSLVPGALLVFHLYRRERQAASAEARRIAAVPWTRP
jgi:UDP-N-acetylmuramyl pentapeptide phosphotransferase/UDP-N-acetylglucosamine-1-phosphate transferase